MSFDPAEGTEETEETVSHGGTEQQRKTEKIHSSLLFFSVALFLCVIPFPPSSLFPSYDTIDPTAATLLCLRER